MSTSINNREFLKALALAVVSLAISAMLLLLAYLLLVPVLHPEFRPYVENDSAVSISIPGNRFRPVVFGDGGFEGQAAVISELAALPPEDHAVLVHRRRFQAGQFPFLRYDIEGRSPALKVMLFWQRADAPGKNFFMELDDSGERSGIHNLLRSEEWKGTITELGIGFFGELREGLVKLQKVKLEPYRSGRLLEVVWGEWMQSALWDQASINRNRGVPKGALIHPVPAVAAWVALGTLLLLLSLTLAKPEYKYQKTVVLMMVMAGWLVLDTHWLKQLLTQNAETRYLFAGKTLHEKKLADWDGEYYGVAHALKDTLAESDRDIIIFYDGAATLSQRLRFHLLPDINTVVMRRPYASYLSGASREYEHVLLLADQGDSPLQSATFLLALDSPHTENWQLIWKQGPAALYATNRSKAISK